MKRNGVLICVAAAVMITAVGLTGCKGGGTQELNKQENEAAKTGEASVQKKTKLVFLRVGTEQDRKAYWEKMVSGFEKENPDIDIEYQECPYGDDFETKLNTGFASRTAPDVINFTLASLGTRAPLGQYVPLNDYVNQWDGKADFIENAVKLGTINGTIYGIPVFPDPRMLVYNKELFKKAGLDPQKPPTNWDELMADHKKLIKKDDKGNVVQTGFGLPTSGINMHQWLSIFLEENGLKNLVDEDTNEILCNKPEALEAVDFMKSLVDAGAIRWSSSNSDQNPFTMGRAAMSITSDSGFKQLNEGELKGKIALADPMSKKRQATFCGMSFMFIGGESEHKDAAWKFIEYISTPENMWTRYEDLGTAPLRKSLESKFVAEDPASNQVIYDSINCGTGSPKVAYANSVYNIINEAMEKVMYGQASSEAAMNTAAKKIQEEIDNK